MLYVYLFVCLVLLGLVVLVFLVASRWGRLRGAVAALLSLAVVVACWPIPIHGGFLMLGDVFVGELRSWREHRHEEQETRRHDHFIASQSERFRGRLDFEPGARVAPGWRTVRTVAGGPLWLDEESGLVWSDALPLTSAEPGDVLSQARKTCAEAPPRGQWALPTDAEGFFLWRHGGEKILPRRPGRFVSQRVDTDFELSIPIIRIVRVSPRPNEGQSREGPSWVVRCVALGPAAPLRGYLDLDISNDDWNAYQLAKTGS